MVRSLRAIHREAKRAERRRIAYQKAAQKQAMLEAGADAAAEYQEMIEALTGAHRITFQRRDWLTIATTPKASAPERISLEEEAACAALARYTPDWVRQDLRPGEGAARQTCRGCRNRSGSG
jgi:hypothetical protein